MNITKLLFLISILSIGLLFQNCDDVENLNPDELTGGPVENVSDENDSESQLFPKSEFPATAIINSKLISFSTVSGTDKARSLTIGTESFVTFTAADNINVFNARYNLIITLQKQDLKLGTNELSLGSGFGFGTGISLTELMRISTGTALFLESGQLTITQIDTAIGIVKGTFEAVFIEQLNFLPTGKSVVVKEGKFQFTYDVD